MQSQFNLLNQIIDESSSTNQKSLIKYIFDQLASTITSNSDLSILNHIFFRSDSYTYFLAHRHKYLLFQCLTDQLNPIFDFDEQINQIYRPSKCLLTLIENIKHKFKNTKVIFLLEFNILLISRIRKYILTNKKLKGIGNQIVFTGLVYQIKIEELINQKLKKEINQLKLCKENELTNYKIDLQTTNENNEYLIIKTNICSKLEYLSLINKEALINKSVIKKINQEWKSNLNKLIKEIYENTEKEVRREFDELVKAAKDYCMSIN